jgi:hypothetical protein
MIDMWSFVPIMLMIGYALLTFAPLFLLIDGHSIILGDSDER